MNKKIIGFGILLQILPMIINSCRSDSVEGNIRKLPPPTFCDTLKSTYQKDIALIIANNCTLTCHKPGSLGSFLLLTDFEKVKENLKNGYMLQSINHEINVSPMPKNKPKLSDKEIAKFLCWKDRGYPEN